MNQFCRTFVSEKHGQILVMLDNDEQDDGVLKIFTKPEGLGVCSIETKLPAQDGLDEKLQSFLAKLTINKVESLAKDLLDFSDQLVE